MSLIAGYFAQRGDIQRGELQTKLQTFRILESEQPSKYDDRIIDTPAGYLLRKVKSEYPIQREPYSDESGNALLILGFLNNRARLLTASQIQQAEGEFVALLAEEDGTVHIINDRFGARPFYVA